MKLNQKIIDWTYFGTRYPNDETVKRHVIFSNVIFLTLPIVYIIFVLIELDSFLEPGSLYIFDHLVVPIIILLCLVFLMLNKFGFTSLSRVLFLASWMLLLHIIPIIIHETPSDYYFAFPAGIIFHSVLIHVSFSSRAEPLKFWFFIAVNFVLMLTCRDILVMYESSSAEENILRDDPYFVLDILLYWMLFNLLMFYMLYVVQYYISVMNNARKLISKQSEELSQKNAELERAVTSLQQANKNVEELNKNLEGKVKQRTAELKLKNEKLVQYAHINSHLLRGPFCRVKGLIVLRNAISKPGGEEDKINELLMHSLDELDEVTIKLQRAVEVNEELI